MKYKTNTGMSEFKEWEVMQIDAYTRNVMNVYASATNAQMDEGGQWYNRAMLLVKEISTTTKVEARRIAYTIAVTSNNIQWETQERVMLAFVEHVLVGGEPRMFLRGIMPDFAEKGARIILEGHYASCVGPKVNAFAENILGNMDVVTLDRHALRVALGHYTDDEMTKKWVAPGRRRRVVEAAYHEAADRTRQPVAFIQAVCWTVCKQNKLYTGRKRGKNKERLSSSSDTSDSGLGNGGTVSEDSPVTGTQAASYPAG